jgi:hypothetical protein
MGHIRLGTLPRTRKWIEVLDLIGGGAGSPEVAAATLDASERGLAGAAKDAGLVHSTWLLTQIPLAARSEDFAARLQELGLEIGTAPSVLEVAGALAAGVDEHLRRKGGRTDLGEMAQMAACEALVALGTPATGNLFETTAPTAQEALKGLSTPKQFSKLAREFFSRLSRKYLSYFLSRELSNYVSGEGRFANVEAHAEFNQGLDLYCRQAARIVEEFSGGWFSKTNYEGGITPEKAARFVHVALKKLRAELARGEPGREQ